MKTRKCELKDEIRDLMKKENITRKEALERLRKAGY